MSARGVIANKHLSDGGESLDDCYPLHRVAAYEIADKYLTALRSAGFAVVPVEPTDAMYFAFMETWEAEGGGWSEAFTAAIKAAQEDSRE